MRILIVEDDDSIAEPLTTGLRREGFEVERARTGRDALAAEPCDVILLDLGLPDIDGFDVARQMRARASTPIIVISARAEEVDRVVALELGADDYLVKPFGFRELVARIRAVTRRASATPADLPTITLGRLTFDRRSRRVSIAGDEVALTPTEFDLLGVLLEDPGAAVPRRRIIDALWDGRWYGTQKTIDVHIAALRRKLGDPRWIETVRGVGFRVVEPG